MPPYVLRLEAISARRADLFGGKARGLGALARAGFPVPAGFAVSTDAFTAFVRETLPPAEWPAALLSGDASARRADRLALTRERLLSAPLPPRVEQAIRDAYAALAGTGAAHVAVRSSSTAEDGDVASGAGVLETVLNVVGDDALRDAIRRCWASLYGEVALRYIARAGTLPRAPAIGVVVQAMVPADKSGVLFTRNPLGGGSDEMLVNCALGLGSAVVDGRISPDTYRIDRWSLAVREVIPGDKRISVTMAPEGRQGVVEREVEPERAERPALSEDELKRLASLGRRVEAHFGAPRDIEWSIAGQEILILQARPITGLAERDRTSRSSRWRGKRAPERTADPAEIVWSNVNVGEALPGVATPLTWSILGGFSELGFRRAFGSLGCSVPRDAKLVGNFRGRIYLNMSEFMAIASQVPGLSPASILAFGGGGEIDRLEAGVPHRSRAAVVARVPLTIARYARENWNLGERVSRFEEEFAAERGRFERTDLRIVAPAALDQTLVEIEQLLERTGAVMLTVYGNLLGSAVAMRALLRFSAGDDAERLSRELLTGLADVDSAAPGLALWHIAEVARTDPAAMRLILETPPSVLRVTALPDGPTRRALASFLTAYGSRGAREAEIAEPRWREDPSLVFATIRGHLLRPIGGGPGELELRRRRIRERAEEELTKRLLPPERTALRHLLAIVQRYTRWRERLRGRVTDVLGMFRAVALEASRRLANAHPDLAPTGGAIADAAFFLTIDELHAYLRGSADALGPLVRQRRVQYERDRTLPDPPDTFVGFPPSVRAISTADGVLTGLAASPGVAEGVVRVLVDPSRAEDLAPGEVLVAPYADVGWSPLFLVASAVVTDMGGPLSHAAVIAREYGVPAVFNVKNGTRILRTGQRVIVDGDLGLVRRV
ncbi:MAG: phosphoenolpyruvate synthase [Deltaproteobacteria bacterium]|nr:phosphoenolpyruvate synthase [Deltaproteobacteria bacterium]